MKWTKLVEAGIDYIRVTSDDQAKKEQMFYAWEIGALSDEKLQYKPQAGGFLGFYGKKTRHVFWGKREEWAMLQVSGGLCREMQSTLLDTRAKATRIDLQVTLQWSEIPHKVLEWAKRNSINARPADGRKWQTKSIDCDNELETVYLGSRQSEWYGRIYDKERESKNESYKNCVRFEIEVKGKAAQAVFEALQRTSIPRKMIVRIVEEWFAKHGIELNLPEMPSEDVITPKKEHRREDKVLAWLSRQVAGSVAFLTSSGYWYPAFKALFGKALTEEDQSSILYSWALIEGR
jgi:DNA relaxase NicK